MDHPDVFDSIAQAARKAGVRLILIGGFAVNAYDYARNTRDIDFLTTEDDYAKITRVLSPLGYEESVRTDVFAKQVSKNKTMPADFLFVDPATFESIWRGGKDTTVSGCSFRLPSLLHLIALKLHAVKQGSKDRAWKDIPDIVNLITANKFDTAATDFKGICQKYGLDGIYQEILKMCSEKRNDGRS